MTNRRTDARGKHNMSPDPSRGRGDIIIYSRIKVRIWLIFAVHMKYESDIPMFSKDVEQK